MITKTIKRKDAIKFINNYIQFNKSTRQWHALMTESEFAQLSYNEWAAKECLDYIKRHPGIPVLDAVADFASKMDDYCCQHEYGECSWPFAVAYDTAMNIYDQLLTYYELNEWKGKSDE